ncbi:MAG: hypothetical protein APF76_10185 [Desulfitibacter sp. BRH_c19]|nr:MAG: hypothetical protein APF76_10185 [Desulfitibacter sp. BRH_c19]
MKKNILLIFVCVLILTLALTLIACGTQDEPAEEPSEPEIEKISLRIAGQSAIDNPDTQAVYRLVDKVKEDSDGSIDITVYPANQLGDYTQVYEELMRGSIDMALISVAPTYDDRLFLCYLPFIAENYEEVKRLYVPDGFMYNTFSEVHGSLGVQFLGFYGEGLGGIGSAKMPIEPLDNSVDKGILLRVPGIESIKLSAEAMGYRTTSIPYAEVYTAMQTGVCDGWLGGPASLNWTGFRDVIDYYIQTNSWFEVTFFLMNKDTWDSLSQEHQSIIKEAVSQESIRSFETAEELNEGYMDQMRDYGIEVVVFTDEELREVAKHNRDVVWPAVRDRIGPELIDELMKQY